MPTTSQQQFSRRDLAVSDDLPQDALDALKDVAIRLSLTTKGKRTVAQQKGLDRARRVLEEIGQDASFLS